MGRKSQFGTLIASAVLLACLALTGQSRAQMARSSAAVLPSATQNKSTFGLNLITRVQRILIADSARSAHSLLVLQAAIAATGAVEQPPIHATVLLAANHPGLHANRHWMRTSRAWAS
jgi:hypothetical protein